jgi:glutathione peroxidase-family protein
MTLYQTCNITFDTDFQFIMGTSLGQMQDSPLFKALKKAKITNVKGITSLTGRVINRLKHRDNSSRRPVNKELGHGYQQLIRSFNTFVLTKNNEGKPIHGDWQNLIMTFKFQEF